MIHIISAIQKKDRGIGYQNDLLYHIPADMKRFRDLTRDTVVIMGRATWESLPDAFRPLPYRENIVLSGQAHYDAPGARVYTSLPEALAYAQSLDKEIFIIGGSSVYAEGLAYADTLHLTLIHGDKPADTFFPPYEHLFTKETKEGDFVSPDGIAYSFVMLEK